MKNNNEYQPINRKLKILLAEDDNADCLLFEEVIAELPVSVNLFTVTNGEELLGWLNKKGNKLPDVLFLDLNMPRKNGFAALGEIKRSSKLQDLPVIIFTTANDKERIKQVYKDAAHYYIRKPNKFSDLKKLVYKILVLISENNISLPDKEHFILKVDS
ncbi:response regulator [Natronogracilivirga saccharolytica]|uniref:Response regulator n=1 Tax=Natronogracilivirga saccharolytica TaxID=2812953 RepID=A0A8J7RUI2_9BACT|nr:response regulator [Natronogracilivirga saccharolytica]MBP3193212.1 response regulator [Natronogracilivirga saccharolytica]